MLSDIMLSDIMLSDIMLSDIMLSDIMLSVAMLSVVILSVAAPFFLLIQTHLYLLKMNRIFFLFNKENFNLWLGRLLRLILCRVPIFVDQTMESLLNGKDQYSWPPSTYSFWLVAFKTVILNTFFWVL